MTKNTLNKKNIISYGLGDIYGGGAFLVIGTLFLIFLTDIVGLSPALAGYVLVIGKVWDAVSDPLMGYISDHTRSRFGRRRIYFLLGIFPIGLSFFMLWYPVKSSSEIHLFLYYAIAYIFFSTVFTMVMVPYSALNAEMSNNFKMRSKLSGSKMLFSQISALMSGVLPTIIVNHFSTYNSNGQLINQKQGYLIMSIIFAFLYSIPWIFVYLGTRELPFESKRTDESLTEKISKILSIFNNRSFRILIGMYVSAYVAMDFLMALFVYFLTYYIQRPELFPYCMLAIILTQIIFIPLYLSISNKHGKGRAYIIGLSVWGIAMFLLFFLNQGSSIYFIVFNCILIGSGLSAGVMIPWAILPSITDVDEVITLEKRTGMYSGMMTLIRKLAQALALWSVGFLLSLIGYQANQVQSPDTLIKLKYIFILIPIVLIIIGIIIASKFKITPQNQKILINEIKRLKTGGMRQNVSPDVKTICEELTGNSYSSGKQV